MQIMIFEKDLIEEWKYRVYSLLSAISGISFGLELKFFWVLSSTDNVFLSCIL